jgi:hypothetical protein
MRLVTALVPTIFVALAMAPTAGAAGPPVVGGEWEAVYSAKLPRGGEANFRIDAGTDRMQWMWIDSRRTTICVSGRRRVRYDNVHLNNTPFHIGPTRHAVRRESNIGKTAGGYERWDLRFNADWSRLSVTMTSRFVHNSLGLCRETLRLSIPRTQPKHAWALGHYAGTTSQGFPISFDAVFDRRSRSFQIKGLAITFNAVGEDGQVVQRTVLPERDETGGAASIDVDTTNGEFSTRMTPGGRPSVAMSGGPEETRADLEATLTSRSASGKLDVVMQMQSGEYMISYTAPGLSFTAARG